MKTIKDQFITYEIALAMKELGFNELCFGYFDKNENLEWLAGNIGIAHWNLPNIDNISAPLWQQCIDWFRKNQNINVEINYLPNIKKWGILSSSMDIRPRDLTRNENIKRGIEITNNFARYDTYQEAREQAIIKAIELCKNK